MPTKKPQNAAASQPVAEPEVAEVKAESPDQAKPIPRKLSFDELKQKAKPVKAVLVPISFIDKETGEHLEAEVWVKRVTFAGSVEISKAFQYAQVEDGDVSRAVSADAKRLFAERLRATICEDEAGSPFFESTDQVYSVSVSLSDALWEATDGVNNFSGKSAN